MKCQFLLSRFDTHVSTPAACISRQSVFSLNGFDNRSAKSAMEKTLREIWRECCERYAERPFLFYDQCFRSYGDINNDVARIAGGLQEAKVRPGARVLVAMSNQPEVVMVHLAIQWLGAITIPLTSTATFDELAFTIRHSEGSHLITDHPGWRTLEHRLAEFPGVTQVVLLGECRSQPPIAGLWRLEQFLDREPLPFPVLHEYDDLSPAMVLYTSGSSGQPKGVVIPAGAGPSVASGLMERLGLTAADNIFVPTPMAHAVGILAGLSSAIRVGCRFTLAPAFSRHAFWDFVAHSGATVCCLFPAHLNLLMTTADRAPASGATTMRAIFTHAWNTSFIRRFGISLHLCWGMTETGGLMAMTEKGYNGSLDHYVGMPLIDTEIVAMTPSLVPRPAGETGELCLRHRHVMLKYLDDPDATRQTLVDGWVRSGDIGTVDESGRVFFHGRLKNVIKRSGENISAEEITERLEELPQVSECYVFGTPDPIRSEEVVAYLSLTTSASATPELIIDRLRNSMSRWKLPRYLVISDDPLPRLPNGKIAQQTIRSGFRKDNAWDRYAYERNTNTNRNSKRSAT